MKRLAALGIPATAWLWLSLPVAQADIGGNVPGPGLCDYPGVGESGMEMGTYQLRRTGVTGTANTAGLQCRVSVAST
jgi:hypothetical protein